MRPAREHIERLKRLGNENAAFYFKQFHVKDDRSTMKVGTDAVLLGIAAATKDTSRILEIGTGCGIISLIMAQRSEAMIDAIEIDEESCGQATENAQQSPWADRINVIHTSLQEYMKHCTLRYDLIVSNPPYFSRSYKSSLDRRNLSRHDDRLSFEELLEGAKNLLEPGGRLWVILPVKEGSLFRIGAGACGFHLHHLIHIHSREGKPVIRVIMGFGREKAARMEDRVLILRDRENGFTRAYQSFAQDFYLDF